MIEWVIEVAQQSAAFSSVIVSTDCEKLAQIAEGCGAEVPFMRSPELADDFTGTSDVIRDAISRINCPCSSLICCLYPTAVFVRPDDLRKGAELLADGDVRWAFVVGEHPAPIQRAYRIDQGQLMPIQVENMEKRSQDLEPAFF